MDNQFTEFSRPWKDQVLQNGAEMTAVFPVSKGLKHTISFICGSPGVMIERVVIDWGGMKRAYTGFTNSSQNKKLNRLNSIL
jgi:hypothetical protein